MSALSLRLAIVAVLLTGCAPAHASSDDRTPDKGGFTYSLGLPSLYKPYAGFELQSYRTGENGALGGLLNFGVNKDLGNPIVGARAIGLSGYGGYRGQQIDGGLRAAFSIPSILFSAGVDYNIRDDEFDFIMRLDLTGRRGGVFGAGSTIALRYLPTRDQTFSVGVSKPLWGKHLGLSRASRDHVVLDDRRPERVEIRAGERHPDYIAALDRLGERVHWVFELTQPFAEVRGGDAEAAMSAQVVRLSEHIATREAGFEEGHSAQAEIRAYHAAVEEAFARALTVGAAVRPEHRAQADWIAAAARSALLEEVLLPYNRLLGQFKKNDSLYGLIAVAQTRFAREVFAGDQFEYETARELWFVFQTLCDHVESGRAWSRKRWEDPRLVWLPLQLALEEHEHDSQAELDALIERAVERPFTRQNELWYIVNESFQWEMARTVRLAEDYHVLWIHDFRGKNGEGDPDLVALRHSINYLQTMAGRVRAYDDTGSFPSYFIIIDQHFFEINDGRRFLGLLQDPLRHEVDLPREYAEWSDLLRAAQEELRQAVHDSRLLRLERSQYGDDWLHDYIKVHVTVTNQADPSYYSLQIAGKIPVPDNNMRDHRKIAFFDITEEDPYRGVAMFTGMGIGEHYAGANWEDRALMIQGPGALEVKAAARKLFETQGFEPQQIPHVLRAKPLAGDYWQRVHEKRQEQRPEWLSEEASEYLGGVIQLHSETGFFAKPVEVAKAVLYTMMPAGSLLQVPDSLWQNYLYASMLAGSSLRGCRVLAISPAYEHAPAGGAANMARAHDLMQRLLVFSKELEGPILDADGLLAVGLYAPRQDVGDLMGRFEQALHNHPDWLQRAFPRPPDTRDQARREVLLGRMAQVLEETGYHNRHLTDGVGESKPKLHLKANFFATGTAWRKLMMRPELADLIVEHVRYLAEQSLVETTAMSTELPDVRAAPESLVRVWTQMIRNLMAECTPEELEQIAYYFTVGSVNLDYRSMMLNAETMILVSSWRSLNGFIDFLLLPGLCEWVDSAEELDALLPAPSTVRRAISNLIRIML